MSDENPIEAKNADDLAKTKKPADIRITDEELAKASGGVSVSDIKLTKPTDGASPS